MTRAPQRIALKHGAGGRAMRRLSEEVFLPLATPVDGVGLKQPSDCTLFGRECVPESPVGACMVSSEGSCKIWHMYGGMPDLREVGK